MVKALRVLVVEDSERDLELLLRDLRKANYLVTHARVETESEMRAALEQTAWDIVISDYRLPEFDANQALATLQQSGVDVPFIILSGTIGEDVAVSALHAGASDFVIKGQTSRLIPSIERALNACEVRLARRTAEAALRESEARYRRMIDTTNEGVLTIDASHKIVFANDRMGVLLGYQTAEILSRSLFDFVAEESRAALARRLDRRPG